MTRLLALASAALLLLTLPACGGNDAAAPEDQDFPPTETGPVPPGGFAEDQVELSIEDQETNDILGTAVLTPEDETSTRVIVLLDEVPEGGGTVEITGARCEEPEAEVTHELGELQDGQLEAMVDAALEDLLAAPHALWVRGAGDGPQGCALIAPFGVDID